MKNRSMSQSDARTYSNTHAIFKKKILIIALSSLANGALAQTATENEPKTLEKVDVIGHYDNAVGTSDSASQGTVTSKLIENRPVLRTGEVLEFIPGMIITQHSGDGKANQYFLRGFNLDHGTDFANYVDGMPVNMRTHAHGQGYSDINFLIPELINRIDYKKGPYYAEEGDFSGAGASHISLMNTLNKGIAEITLGSNSYQQALLASSTKTKMGNLLYALEIAHNNGPWDNPENFKKWNGVLRWSRGTQDDGYNVTAMGYEAKWDSTDQIPRRAIDSGQIDRFGAIDNTDGGETARYSLSFGTRKKNNAGVLEANAYAIQSRLNLIGNFSYFLNDPVNGDQIEQAEKRRIYGGAISQLFSGKLGSIDTINKVGVQVRQDNLDPVALYTTVARNRTNTVRQDKIKESSAGFFVENTTQWLEKFRSIAGVRHDRYSFNVQSSLAVNSGKTDATITSPKLSLIFGPWAKTEYFINAGRGFHSNDARGTTITIEPQTGNPADKQPPLVRSTGSEIGLRTEIVPGLQSSLAFWRLKSDSELIFVGDSGTTEAGRPSKRHGVEWSNHYAINSKFFVDFDVAASRSRFTDDDPAGNYIPDSINKVASLGLSVVDYGPWFGNIQYRYFGPRTLIEDNSQRSQSTSLTYLRIGRKLTTDWKVSLDVFNLFNRNANDIDYYYTSRLQGEPLDGVADYHIHPVEKRSFRLTLTGNF